MGGNSNRFRRVTCRLSQSNAWEMCCRRHSVRLPGDSRDEYRISWGSSLSRPVCTARSQIDGYAIAASLGRETILYCTQIGEDYQASRGRARAVAGGARGARIVSLFENQELNKDLPCRSSRPRIADAT